jgi:predicted Rossmann-fold nucleotide-binding protein
LNQSKFDSILKIRFTVRLVINTTLPTDEELNELFPHIQMGGHWHPEHCHPRQRLGIFVPMKRRWHQLPIFLRHLHQVLVSQWRHYTIFVVEQAGKILRRIKHLMRNPNSSKLLF